MTPVDDARIGELRFHSGSHRPRRPELRIDGIFGDSEAFYLNLHSTEFPGGVLRGDLQTKEISYLRHLNFHSHLNEDLVLARISNLIQASRPSSGLQRLYS